MKTVKLLKKIAKGDKALYKGMKNFMKTRNKLERAKDRKQILFDIANKL